MFLNVCKQTNFSHISRARISKSKRCFIVKSSTYYFHMKTKILADFQICISVPFKCSFSVWRKYFQMNSIIFIRSLTELIDMSCLLSKVKLRNIENFLIKYLWSLLTSLVLKSLLYIQVIFVNSFTYPLLWILWFVSFEYKQESF